MTWIGLAFGSPLKEKGYVMPMAADWEAYARGVEADIAQLQKDLARLVSGAMTIGEREGDGPWRDVTQETIDHDRRVIATYEAILKDVRTNRIKDR